MCIPEVYSSTIAVPDTFCVVEVPSPFNHCDKSHEKTYLAVKGMIATSNEELWFETKGALLQALMLWTFREV